MVTTLLQDILIKIQTQIAFNKKHDWKTLYGQEVVLRLR